MARAPWAPEGLYEVVQRWARDCLREDGSLFARGRRIWTVEVAATVAERLLAADPARQGFIGKLEGQIRDLGDDVIQFAAEALYVHTLAISNMLLATKRSQIEEVLGWMSAPVSIPPEFVAPLDGGVADFGAGLAQRPAYLRYLLLVVHAVKGQGASERDARLGDAWAFRAFIDDAVPSSLMQRGAVLHLLFPETFEYALVADDKRRIHGAFAAIDGAAGSDDDRALVEIRQTFEATLGMPLNLYADWFASIWRGSPGEIWAEIAHWSDRLLAWPGFDGEERDYKIAIAARLSAARTALLGGDEAWRDHLRSALSQSNTLTHWQWENQPFMRFCDEQPAEARLFLEAVWSDEQSVRVRLTAASARLPTTVLKGAARVTMTSLLLSAVDVTLYPLYRSRIVSTFRLRAGDEAAAEPPELDDRNYTPGELAVLLGIDGTTVRDFLRGAFPRPPEEAGAAWDVTRAQAQEAVDELAPTGSDDVDVYLGFLNTLDHFRARLIAAGVSTRDRLDAQSLVWWLTKGSSPDEWSPEDRDAFNAFQRANESVDPIPPGPAEVEPGSRPRRAWLVRGANVGGRNLVPEWVAEGYVSVGWSELGIVDAGSDANTLYAAIQQAYPDDSPGAWRASTGNLHRFLTRMVPGDLVLTVNGDALYLGRLTGGVLDDDSGSHGLERRRSVEWLNPADPASRADVREAYPSLYSRLRTLLTVTDLSTEIEALLALLQGLTPVPTPVTLTVPAVSQETADRLHLPLEWLQRDVADVLMEKKQVVFYGPPGTGKTLVAQRLADDLIRDGGEATLIQFHPSYTYEDFFEGYRPVQTSDGVGISYELTPGPLRRLAEAATADPSRPYVLIIDEINRGNIPKIFGELLFLLEYRDERIPLQYSPDTPFGLPPNVLVIATMNTADRSIALVDAALRRRFLFVAFSPREPPIDGVLRRWLDANGLPDDCAQLMVELNDRLAAHELALGPSYFITGDGRAPDLERVWRHGVVPLLEEHFYGTDTDVGVEFGLPSLRRAVTPTPATGPESDGEQASPAAN